MVSLGLATAQICFLIYGTSHLLTMAFMAVKLMEDKLHFFLEQNGEKQSVALFVIYLCRDFYFF